MPDMSMYDRVMEHLSTLQFFYGQRAGWELWSEKPKKVQNEDIADFNRAMNEIRRYIQQLEMDYAQLKARSELQKPLIPDVALSADYCWLEVRGGNYTQPCDCYFSDDLKGVSVRRIGSPFFFPLETYGRRWRCWLMRPTAEEREAAEWEDE